jgi:hypothetical protein
LSRKITIAASALATLTLIGYSADASAAWVAKSDAWCKKHGLKPVCEIYEKDKIAIGAHSDAAADAQGKKPKVGQTRGGR